MKKLIILILFVSVGITLASYYSITSEGSTNNLKEGSGLKRQQVKNIFKHIQQYPNNTQFAIALINKDSCRFYGTIKKNDTISTINNSKSLFEIGSITKLLTSALFANFVLDSTLSLDRDIKKDLRFPLNNELQITYKQLANHTSGLARRPSDLFFPTLLSPFNPYKNYTTEKLETFLQQKVSLNRTSGSKYEYSNLGMGLLGYLLSEVSQNDYETLLQEYIFSQYGMISSTTQKEQVKDEMVTGLNLFGFKTPYWNLASLVACGGVISSTEDLSKFVQAQFDSTNLEFTLTREPTFVVDSTLAIGLAWHIIKDKAETDWFFHNGGTGGFRSALVCDPITKKGVVILSNVSVYHPKNFKVDSLCFELMSSLYVH